MFRRELRTDFDPRYDDLIIDCSSDNYRWRKYAGESELESCTIEYVAANRTVD